MVIPFSLIFFYRLRTTLRTVPSISNLAENSTPGLEEAFTRLLTTRDPNPDLLGGIKRRMGFFVHAFVLYKKKRLSCTGKSLLLNLRVYLQRATN